MLNSSGGNVIDFDVARKQLVKYTGWPFHGFDNGIKNSVARKPIQFAGYGVLHRHLLPWYADRYLAVLSCWRNIDFLQAFQFSWFQIAGKRVSRFQPESICGRHHFQCHFVWKCRFELNRGNKHGPKFVLIKTMLIWKSQKGCAHVRFSKAKLSHSFHVYCNLYRVENSETTLFDKLSLVWTRIFPLSPTAIQQTNKLISSVFIDLIKQMETNSLFYSFQYFQDY